MSVMTKFAEGSLSVAVTTAVCPIRKDELEAVTVIVGTT